MLQWEVPCSLDEWRPTAMTPHEVLQQLFPPETLERLQAVADARGMTIIDLNYAAVYTFLETLDDKHETS